MSQIIVGVRVRPFNQREIKYNSCNIVAMNTTTNTIFLTQVRQGKVLKDEKPKEFAFDHALWTHDQTTLEPIATQEYTYIQMGRPVLSNVLSGYNACLFAYGQTGSGKTYSMMGYGSEIGVTPRLCDELFQHIQDTHTAGAVKTEDGGLATTLVSVEASYLEIYNEIVKDLLGEPHKGKTDGLKIRQHPKTGVFVDGLKKHTVTSKDAIVKLLEDGQALRSVAATQMNATSSRSHAILMVTVTHTTTTTLQEGGQEMTTTAVKNGKLSLVDLAGSERASSTGAQGETLHEGANINKSLSFLGMCLSRLAEVAESGKSGGHIPFRDSSLTFLLSDNLGGNSKTSMLANISPAEINYDETLSTLRFAQVTKKVKNHAVVNENPTTKLIRELKDELEQLKAQLKAHHEGKSVASEGIEDSGAADAADAADAEADLVKKLQESEAAALALEHKDPGEEQLMTKDASETRSLFVDWRRPQLVNLCPESATIVLPVEEGKTFWMIDPASAVTDLSVSDEPTQIDLNLVDRSSSSSNSCPKTIVFCVNYVPLLNTATLSYTVCVKASSSAAAQRPLESAEIPLPSVNGHVLDPKIVSVEEDSDRNLYTGLVEFSQSLFHSDRIVLGQLALRVSHSTSLPSMPEFSAVPVDISHLETLEAMHRTRDIAHACAEEYQNLFSVFVEDAPSPIEEGASTGMVESAALIARDLDDGLGQVNTDMRQLEEFLINHYPTTLQEQTEFLDQWRAAKQASGDSADEKDYSAVVEEANKGLDSKQQMIESLKQELSRASSLRRKREESMARFAKRKELEDDERNQKVNEEVEEDMNQTLEKEMVWHSEVRKLRLPAPNGPRDPKDLETWKQLGTANKAQVPFLQQVLQEVVNSERKTSRAVLAGKKSKDGKTTALPVSRCGMIWKQKQNAKGFDERFFAISGRFLYYFHQPDGRERCRGAIYLYGATIARLNPTIEAELGRKYCLLLTSPCPRSASETGNSFYLSFASENDLNVWEKWLQEASAPPMPASMRQRQEEELEEQIRNGTRAPLKEVSGSVKLGNAGRFNWKNEAGISNCEHCAVKFGFFTSKHHCDTCGGVFCYKCAPATAGSQRSCGMCRAYGEVRPEMTGDDFELVEEEDEDQ